ncbi:hypothetical protein FS837_010291 [Tulasnella sp. UAMH 9824]|nr:hypothetical protein FS837_010291 [Tulasnella sp. UAMH 9824]
MDPADRAVRSTHFPNQEAPNSLLPISRLHQELFHHILQLVLSQNRDEYPSPSTPFRYYADLFVLRWVSHGWEHEIANTPRFWTLMSPRLSEPFQDLMWERSGAAALDIQFSSRESPISGVWSEAEKAFLARTMTREIRKLHITVPPGENLDWYVVEYHHPRMKVLWLHGQEQIVCTGPLRIPQLEELHLKYCEIIWDNLQNLRVLSVDVSNGPNLAQLVQILQSSPQLEHLSLTNIYAASDGAAIPLTPIYLPQLSHIAFRFISLEIASGILERIFTSAACRVVGLVWRFEQGSAWSGLFHHAGRICAPQRPEEQTFDPKLQLRGGELYLETDPDRGLYIFNFNDEQTTVRRVAEAARIFFETSKRLPFGTQGSRFRLEFQYPSHVSEGIKIVQELFPDTAELGVACYEGLEGLEVLAEPTIEGGKPVWVLPKLAVLKLRTKEAFDYGGIIAMTIKRTQAATSSPSALSPIALLRLGPGHLHSELIGRLEEAGIAYEREDD